MTTNTRPIICQAIETKFVPATNYKGSRIKATCARGSIVTSYDHASDSDSAHREAVDALVNRFAKEDAGRYGSDTNSNPWMRPRITGQLRNGNQVHVFVKK